MNIDIHGYVYLYIFEHVYIWMQMQIQLLIQMQIIPYLLVTTWANSNIWFLELWKIKFEKSDKDTWLSSLFFEALACDWLSLQKSP